MLAFRLLSRDKIRPKGKFSPIFFILLPPTLGDKRGSRTKKTEAALPLPVLFFKKEEEPTP
jgi:hypothetical protein